MNIKAPESTEQILRWKPLLKALDDFQSYFTDHLPVLRPENLADRELGKEYYDTQRRKGAYKGTGVYLHYDNDGILLYVGVSLNTLDRCWANDVERRRWIDVIRFERKVECFALALENFLIKTLSPRNNVSHKMTPDIQAG